MRTRALDRKEVTKKVELAFSLKNTTKKDALVAKEAHSCDCRDGKLQTAPGGVQLLNENGTKAACSVPEVTCIRFFKVYNTESRTYAVRYLVLNESGELYVQEGDGTFLSFGSGFRGATIERFAGGDFRYKLALIAQNTCLFLNDDMDYSATILNDTSKTGCFFNHRMFVGMKPSKLVCSAPEDELNFTDSINEGGMIRFPWVGGELVAVKAFADQLYVFFEYGILRVNTAGSPKDFSVKELEYAGGRILGRSVCVGVRGVYFLASDGAYRFDGEKTERILPDLVLAPKEETLLESGAAFSGRILFRYLMEDGYKTLVIYEDGKDGFYMDELPAMSAEEGGRCLFTDENGTLCQLSDQGDFGFDGRFFSKETDLGLAGRKTLTKLCFQGEGSFTLTVKTGGRSFCREVEFKDGRAEVKLSERGENFIFDFLLKYGSKIEKMTAELIALR